MKKNSIVIFVAFFVLSLANGTLWADAIIKSHTSSPLVAGVAPITFEGAGLDRYTPISTEYAGVTFGQVALQGNSAGSPQIDTYSYVQDYDTDSWLYAYGASSGIGVLISSASGGYEYPALAGLTIAFQTPVSVFQTFFSDTAPLGGDYTIQAFGSGSILLDSFPISRDDILSTAYLAAYGEGDDRDFPTPNRDILPGIYIGFVRDNADIVSIQIGPGSASLDAFAIDDVQFKTTAVPEPATMLLLGLGLMGLAGIRRKIE